MRSDAENLKVITDAIKRHNTACDSPAIAIAMNPFEIERLGWDEIMGLPLEADDKLGTGRFHVLCSGQTTKDEEETVTEAISKDQEETRTLVTV